MRQQKYAHFFTFCFCLAAYLFCAAGYIDTIDADPSYELARAIAERGSFRLAPKTPDSLLYADTVETPGKVSSKLGLGMALLYVPCIWLTPALSAVLGVSSELVARFLISITNCFVTALLVSSLWDTFLKRGFSVQQASLIAFVAGFTTLLFPYSKSCHREPMQALLLLWLFVLLENRKYFLSAICFGAGLNVKAAWMIAALPAAILGLGLAYKESKLRQLILPAILISTGLPLYQWICFGSPFNTGYNLSNVGFGGVMWQHPFWLGVWRQVFDYRSGFLIFNLATCLCFGVAFWRAAKNPRITTETAFDLAIVASFLLQCFFYARWYTPLGGEALGPRYLVTSVPSLFLLIRRPADLTFLNRRRKTALAAISVLFVFQSIHVAVKPQQYWDLADRTKTELPPHWVCNFIFFFNKLGGRPEIYRLGQVEPQEVNLQGIRSLEGFNFWWAHAARYNWKKSETLPAPRGGE